MDIEGQCIVAGVADELAEEYRDDPGETACYEWARDLYCALRDWEAINNLEELRSSRVNP